MSSPYSTSFQAFATGTAATATAALPQDSYWAGRVELQAVTTGFSGTFRFQGRPHPDAQWVDLPYIVLGASPAVALGTVTLTTDTSVITYVILKPAWQMQVVMTRSAGSFGMLGQYFGAPYDTATVTSTPSSLPAAASSVYSPVSSAVTAAVIKASAGNALHIYATNANAAVRWFQLHNKATIPLATEVPQRSFLIPAGSATVPGYVEFCFKFADQFTAGIGFAISTTQGTFTDSATAADHTKHVEYA